MKMMAFYLPQFHEIPENNKWWGQGFTEWTNTKATKPLYQNHKQPKEPLNDNYYNLLDKKTLQWQAKLANNYGIDGFCFYHYWFNGKLLLEKPAEILLENKDINTSFCFSWANEPWTRSWDGKSKEVLIDQQYGSEEDWHKHINYLLKFFNDDRYEKIDNKPVFVIYRPRNIQNIDKMIAYWNKQLIANGFDGLYLIDMLTSFDNKPYELFDASLDFEPMLTLKYYIPKTQLFKRGYKKVIRDYLKKRTKKMPGFLIDKIDYEVVWDSILKRNIGNENETKKRYLGAFVSWDNTPRKKEHGLILENFNMDIFEQGLQAQYKKTQESGNEFLFINAWNEWAEGTYMEPDKNYEYQVLETIQKIKEDNLENK